MKIMNENIDLTKILERCPVGTKLYSPALGEVEFVKIVYEDGYYPIKVIGEKGNASFTSQGKLFNIQQGECLLFPSKDRRDWSKFNLKKERFDPKTLKPFDKVLVRDYSGDVWNCSILLHIQQKGRYLYTCINGANWEYCIPYNDDTKHLAYTANDAPEFYRYWED